MAEVDQSYPASLDWRDYGVIAFIKNQAWCGCCYAFATMEAVQSLYQIKTGPASSPYTVLNLSEQQIVDCSQAYGNQGCNGGLMTYTMNYMNNYPIELEATYPYTAYQ